MTIPTTMRAVRFDRAGGPEVLAVRELPVPVPRDGEVLVRVHAAGLNPKDVLFRERHVGAKDGRSRGTGFDVAGEVAMPGPGVGDLAIGTRVFGFLDGLVGGTAAEYVTVPRAWLARMPDALDWPEAAALPLAASAALQALRDVARVRAGEHVLIKGASGGVGSAAIQLARSFGARVTAITSAAGLAHARRLGADAVIDAREFDPRAVDRPGMRGAFDVLLDCAGSTPVRTHRRLLASRGRWVTVAPSVSVFALAPITAVTSRLLGGRRFGYLVVRPRRDDLETIARLSSEGRLTMPIASRHPLEAIADAHRAVAARGTLGKRVLLVQPTTIDTRTERRSDAIDDRRAHAALAHAGDR